MAECRCVGQAGYCLSLLSLFSSNGIPPPSFPFHSLLPPTRPCARFTLPYNVPHCKRGLPGARILTEEISVLMFLLPNYQCLARTQPCLKYPTTILQERT